MTLELKNRCDRCDRGLPAGALALICSYECTFCGDCARALGNVCPNCGGELIRRPRPAGSCNLSAAPR